MLGINGSGQLGDGTSSSSFTPMPVTGIDDAVSVSTSGADIAHTCALLKDGSIECSGDNEWGELGDGTTTTSLVPVRVK